MIRLWSAFLEVDKHAVEIEWTGLTVTEIVCVSASEVSIEVSELQWYKCTVLHLWMATKYRGGKQERKAVCEPFGWGDLCPPSRFSVGPMWWLIFHLWNSMNFFLSNQLKNSLVKLEVACVLLALGMIAPRRDRIDLESTNIRKHHSPKLCIQMIDITSFMPEQFGICNATSKGTGVWWIIIAASEISLCTWGS